MEFTILFTDWYLQIMIMPSDECHRTLLMISQHWSRWWLGAVRQQAITWTSVDQDLQRHMAWLGPNELINHRAFNYIIKHLVGSGLRWILRRLLSRHCSVNRSHDRIYYNASRVLMHAIWWDMVERKISSLLLFLHMYGYFKPPTSYLHIRLIVKRHS